jgi:DNA-binding PadR family transcriptional regulator
VTNARNTPPQVDGDEAVGDFYARSTATTEQERALIVAYWVQEIRGDGEFDAQSVNSELKHLGHGVSNITRALDDLKARKPQLVIQTQKSGKSKQARKVYKVTAAGKTEVMRLLAAESQQ